MYLYKKKNTYIYVTHNNILVLYNEGTELILVMWSSTRANLVETLLV